MRHTGQVPNVLHKAEKTKPGATARDGVNKVLKGCRGWGGSKTVSNYIPLQRPSLNTPRFSITNSLNAFY